MLEERLKSFDPVVVFTRKDYYEFRRAVEARENYRFDHNSASLKISLSVSGRKCDNGCWEDNYLYGLSHSKSYGDYYGRSSPYCPVRDGVKTYEEIIGFFEKGFGVTPKKQRQLDLFGLFDEPTSGSSRKSDYSM